MTRTAFLGPLLCGCLALHPVTGHAQTESAPDSAIRWLEQALQAPQAPPVDPAPAPAPPEVTPILPHAQFEEIAVTPLSASQPDEAGLFTAERIGLPRNLWGPTPVAEIITAIEAMPSDTLPSAARLGLRVLMAEFAAPLTENARENGALLLARVDKLVALGALEQAMQLIESVTPPTAALKVRAFDIALLLGEEDRACEAMQGQITPSEGQGAQLFCMARRGNWQAAHAGLNVAKPLGLITPTEAALLRRFLEEEEAEEPQAPPQTMTPLSWRMLEALGEPVPTATLPVAYAHADLRGISGWRAQLDAAERLTRTKALQPNRLFGLYTQRRAAASGGLWERVRAVQQLETALEAGAPERIGAALVEAYSLFAAVELESAFAAIHADALAEFALDGPAAETLWKVLLLAQTHVERAAALAPDSTKGAFTMALAQGAALPEAELSDMATAIRLGFEADALPESIAAQITSGAKGLALLGALDHVAQAAAGDLHAATRALQALRALDLDEVARQIAIELMLLERRG